MIGAEEIGVGAGSGVGEGIKGEEYDGLDEMPDI